jgi:hypothetical protein
MSVLDDIYNRMEAAGVFGGATGWTGYKGFKPETPDKVVVIYLTPGEPPDQSQASFDYPRFQVFVRSAKDSDADAYIKIQDVFDALHNQTLTDGAMSPPTPWTYCYAVQTGPLPLGRDANGRLQLVINFKGMKPR